MNEYLLSIDFSGGNDGLCYMERLNQSVNNVGEAALVLNEIRKDFSKVIKRLSLYLF